MHVLATLPLAALLLLILGKLFVDTIYLQAVAAQHANLVAVADSLTRQLRQDAWATATYRQTGNGLALQTVGAAGSVPVIYTFEPELVRRTALDGDERVWRCRRLQFDWHVEGGPRGDVLWLDLREIRPARATAVLPRSYAVTFLLPPGGELGSGATEAKR
jgi:hypothetical protein